MSIEIGNDSNEGIAPKQELLHKSLGQFMATYGLKIAESGVPDSITMRLDQVGTRAWPHENFSIEASNEDDLGSRKIADILKSYFESAGYEVKTSGDPEWASGMPGGTVGRKGDNYITAWFTRTSFTTAEVSVIVAGEDAWKQCERYEQKNEEFRRKQESQKSL